MNKKDLIKLADELWERAIHKKYGERCAYSGQEGHDAHHIFFRRHTATRWDLENGVLLSRERHTMSTSLSAHGTPAKFLGWVMNRMGERKFNALEKKSREIFRPNVKELEEIIAELKLKV